MGIHRLLLSCTYTRGRSLGLCAGGGAERGDWDGIDTALHLLDASWREVAAVLLLHPKRTRREQVPGKTILLGSPIGCISIIDAPEQDYLPLSRSALRLVTWTRHASLTSTIQSPPELPAVRSRCCWPILGCRRSPAQAVSTSRHCSNNCPWPIWRRIRVVETMDQLTGLSIGLPTLPGSQGGAITITSRPNETVALLPL
jgi:hypothetical protein